MGDGSCDPQNLSSECDWDGGDCCICTCDDDDNEYACGTDGYLCLDPTFRGNDTCEEESLPACPVYNQTFIVENTAQAVTLAKEVNCSGGVFHVEWMGNIVVDTEIVVSYGTTLNITGVGSSAVLDGGRKTRLFRVVSSSLQLNGVQINNGSATFGGAIAAIDSTLALHRTSFIGNRATDKNGGAVFVHGSSISFSGQTDFFNNSAEYGGALYVASNSSILWEGVSNFRGNTASHSGGVLAVVVGSTVSWEAGTTFEGNAASTYRGGALFLEGGSSASWNEEANFIANSAFYEGDAIFLDIGSNASWRGGANFSHNSVTFAGGGALLIADSSTVQLSGKTLFEFNKCGAEGGAVSSREASSNESIPSVNQESFLLITGPTIFANNKCISNGGGLALLGGLSASFEASNAIFIGNEAGEAGGAVYITDGGPIFHNTTFISNTADVGGGVFVSNSTITFRGCYFVQNKAVVNGGATEIDNSTTTINNTYFIRNRAANAGALQISGAASLERCLFWENYASESGTSVISRTSTMYTMDIANCYFSGNGINCPSGTFLDESESGDRFDFICSGCEGCASCTIENRWKVPTTCVEALEHTTSSGGNLATIENLLIDPGYWRATNESTNILKCYNQDACLGGLTDSTHFCHGGYTGPYCTVCIEAYKKGPGFTCMKCSGSVSSIIATAAIVVIAIVIALTVFMFLTSAEIAETVRGITVRLLRLVPLHSIKIIIVTWQIVTQFMTATGITYPGLYQRFLNAVNVANFDLAWMLSAACIIDLDFHGQLLIVTIGPSMVMLLLSGTYSYVINRHRASEEILQSLRNKHMSMVLLVMFLVYPSSSSKLLKMFDCEFLDDGKDYLRADYTIECDELRHRGLMVYSTFMILLYPLGIPAFFSFLLFRNREVLMDEANRKEALSVRSFSDLWKQYKPSRFYFEVIECCRRIVHTVVVSITYDDSATQISVTLMFAFVFTVISEGLAPYVSQWDAWVSRLGHAVVCFSVYYALLLKVDVSDERSKSQDTFETVLVTTHAVMVVLIICEAALTGFCLQKEQVEDLWPRFNRHCPQRVRTTSHSLRGTSRETRDSLDGDEVDIQLRTRQIYWSFNSSRQRSHPAVFPLQVEPAHARKEPL